MRAHNLAAVTIAFAVVACTDATMPEVTGPGRPARAMSAVADAGNPYFTFLAPMVANPGSGTNVAGLAPVVDICAWDGNACTASLAHFTTDLSTTTTTQPGNSETVRQGNAHYIVNWHTEAFNLDVGATYRVCVSVGSLALGHADVEVAGNAQGLKDLKTGANVGLLDGRTLPIAFRIEAGALEQAADAGCGGGGGAVPGTISGTVSLDADGLSGYPVYLLDATGTLVVASTVTNATGAYTFTSSQFVAGTSYLVCEANPVVVYGEDIYIESSPFTGGSCIDTSVYAPLGYQVIAPAIAGPGVGGNNFVNSINH